MPLKNVIKQNWEILYYQHSESRCDIEDYLEEIPLTDYHMLGAKIEQLAQNGSRGVPSTIFHEAGEDYIIRKGQPNEIKCKMYGLHHGRHRLYAIVIASRKEIIFTHGTLKRTQATDKKDKDRFKNIVKRLKNEGEL